MKFLIPLLVVLGSVVPAGANQSPFAWRVDLNKTYRCSDGSVMALQSKGNHYTFEVDVGDRHDDSDASVVPALMPLHFVFDKRDEAYGGIMFDEFKRRMGTVAVLSYPPVVLKLTYDKRDAVFCSSY